MFFPKFHSMKLYKKMVGEKCNLKTPTTLNEKLMYYKFYLYWDNLLVNKCADKFEVRDYVKNKGLKKILPPLLGCWDNFDQIDFDSLPNKFALKLTNGSGYNILCYNKDALDKKKAKKKFDKWIKQKYGLETGEQGIYRNVKKRIIAEPLIETDNDMPPLDFKFFCSHGEVKFLFVASDRKEGQTKFDFYYPDWTWIPVKNAHPNAGAIDKPEGFELMKKYAEILSEDFPLVRVDFFCNEGIVSFGELTFTHMGCIHPFSPHEFDKNFGDMFPLVDVNKEEIGKYAKKRKV